MGVSVTEQRACQVCQAVTPHRVTRANHGLHVVLSILTAGIWLIGWMFAALFAGSASCQTCELRARGGASAPPPRDVAAAMLLAPRKASNTEWGIVAGVGVVLLVVIGVTFSDVRCGDDYKSPYEKPPEER